MQLYTILDIIAIVLIGIHFGVPLIYYWYIKTRWLPRSWNIKTDPNYQPKVTIITPTYMGAKWIAQRLDNIYEQDYPRNKIEIIIVDSNSPDGTAETVLKWMDNHKDITNKLIVEPIRRGKLSAVLEGLKHVSPDSKIIVLTDDDCIWKKDALRNVVKFFTDPVVGAVTGSIKYLEDDTTENKYRFFYNIMRIGESKWWSTPIHNGPLLALRKSVVNKIGLPKFPGADDSALASYIAFTGYRAIQADDAWTYEPSTKNQHKRMIRRATHLITYFTKLKRHAKKQGIYTKTKFDKIWHIEAYLHFINPFLLLLLIILLIISMFQSIILALTLLLPGIALLIIKPYGTWIKSQFYLLIAIMRSLRTRENIWSR